VNATARISESPSVARDPVTTELDPLTLRRAQRGEARACRAFVERYQTPVFALLSRLVGRDRCELSEDLAQETFLSAFRTLAQFSPLGPARLSTWILTIAARRAIDELRRHRLVTESEISATGVAASVCADESSRQQALATAIAVAVEELRPETRAAFLLREYHGLEYAEIARALGVELGTVKSRVSRARDRVRLAAREVRHDRD
jgi:RNA polymerase sigma-70 factor (ECF subfamily)